MVLKQIAKQIYAIESDTSYDVAKMFLRFQENYESPKFRNKTFTLKEFKEFYKKYTNRKTFTYYSDWSGFNIPGYIVRRFENGSFGSLSRDEKWLINSLKKANVKGKFYLLGYAKKSADVKKHEIAHGLFYTNREYKKEVIQALLGLPNETKNLMVGYLLKIGYHGAVVIDELHAWALTEKDYLKKKKIWNKDLTKLNKILQEIFYRYSDLK